MGAFLPEDRAKDLKALDLATDTLPMQRSLVLAWNLESDTFTFKVSNEEKPFTKRGILSTVNSLFDPLGFIAPVIVQGKIFLRNVISGTKDWDDPLPVEQQNEWKAWKDSLKSVEQLHIRRTYAGTSFNNIVSKELHIFADASEQAIAAVAYLLTTDKDGNRESGFVLGKAKVAPTHGHTIPRLKLCAAVLAVELHDIILEQLEITTDSTHFYTDSKVTLGYICNESRRFHIYASNRVERIRRSTSPDQWTYVATNKNPADLATRSLPATQMETTAWIVGPSHLVDHGTQVHEAYSLVDPDYDKEIRPNVTSLTTNILSKESLGSAKFERFSNWKTLIKTIAHLKHIAQSHSNKNLCKGWHICTDSRSVELFQAARQLIVKEVQHDAFNQELTSLQEQTSLPKASPLLTLNPILDSDGLLRVGGRINRSEFPTMEKNPIVVPRHHHVATLLVRDFYETVKHQGRHFTEGAIRAAGFWILSGKRLIASILHKCVTCRKLRGKQELQKMADLPPHGLKPAPPFTYVGVDAFGPWSVVARRTRGGLSNSKRWAIIFTCFTTRAINIEVIEDMGTSGFINALRRFIGIRGKVKEFCSDQGSNFIGTVNSLNMQTNLEQRSVKDFLYDNEIVWRFNPPHSSRMGGVWERMIGVTRRILDSMLKEMSLKNLIHEVLCTLMAEVCSIVNARPIVPVSSDHPENPSS